LIFFSGKTHLANAVAGQLGVPYFRVSAPELVAGMSGESESRIRDLFKAASNAAPSLIFMDELDVIAAKRSGDGGGRGMEKRMVAQLLTSMDSVSPSNNRNNCAVVVIAATNRPDAMDPALRRAGRFDREILLGVPDEEARERMIGTMTTKMRLYGDFDCKVLARKTPGYVGADIKSLSKEAAVIAINRIFCDVLCDDGNIIQTKQSLTSESIGGPIMDENDTSCLLNAKGSKILSSTRHPLPCVGEVSPLTSQQMEPLYVTMDDFLAAIPLVQPSAKREGFAIIPDVTWNDVGALHSIRQDLKMSVLEPIRNPERFKQLGLPLPAGVMLYGPPGCGKTLLAKAIANESGANFISVKGPELLDKYVGESERSVRLVFERARSSSPCIIFFDELDSLVPRRGSGGDGGGGVSERVVNQLLTEMDGLDSRRSVFVIAATNRPELIDPAMMRPGRLDKLLYVPLPTAEERVHIIQALASKVQLHSDVDLASIVMSPRANGYSGADCAALIREAGLAVLKEMMDATASNDEASATLCISSRHFDIAFTTVMPSVSKKDQARYDRLRDVMARARSRGNEKADNATKEGQNEST
jgi:ribosome biogenesis ATPase